MNSNVHNTSIHKDYDDEIENEDEAGKEGKDKEQR